MEDEEMGFAGSNGKRKNGQDAEEEDGSLEGEDCYASTVFDDQVDISILNTMTHFFWRLQRTNLPDAENWNRKKNERFRRSTGTACAWVMKKMERVSVGLLKLRLLIVGALGRDRPR